MKISEWPERRLERANRELRQAEEARRGMLARQPNNHRIVLAEPVEQPPVRDYANQRGWCGGCQVWHDGLVCPHFDRY